MWEFVAGDSAAVPSWLTLALAVCNVVQTVALALIAGLLGKARRAERRAIDRVRPTSDVPPEGPGA